MNYHLFIDGSKYSTDVKLNGAFNVLQLNYSLFKFHNSYFSLNFSLVNFFEIFYVAGESTSNREGTHKDFDGFSIGMNYNYIISNLLTPYIGFGNGMFFYPKIVDIKTNEYFAHFYLGIRSIPLIFYKENKMKNGLGLSVSINKYILPKHFSPLMLNLAIDIFLN